VRSVGKQELIYMQQFYVADTFWVYPVTKGTWKIARRNFGYW